MLGRKPKVTTVVSSTMASSLPIVMLGRKPKVTTAGNLRKKVWINSNAWAKA